MLWHPATWRWGAKGGAKSAVEMEQVPKLSWAGTMQWWKAPFVLLTLANLPTAKVCLTFLHFAFIIYYIYLLRYGLVLLNKKCCNSSANVAARMVLCSLLMRLYCRLNLSFTGWTEIWRKERKPIGCANAGLDVPCCCCCCCFGLQASSESSLFFNVGLGILISNNSFQNSLCSEPFSQCQYIG